MALLKKILEQQGADIENKVAAFERTLQSLYPELDKVGMYYDRSNGSLFLSDLYVKEEHRGTGVGTKVMNSIIKFADTENLPMVLIPEPDDDNISPKKLMDFYKKFGFIINKGKRMDYTFSMPFATTMYRMPKS
jgi:GNAT superfamily N-acetyltransferase